MSPYRKLMAWFRATSEAEFVEDIMWASCIMWACTFFLIAFLTFAGSHLQP